jgi:hypothetical protein
MQIGFPQSLCPLSLSNGTSAHSAVIVLQRNKLQIE